MKMVRHLFMATWQFGVVLKLKLMVDEVDSEVVEADRQILMLFHLLLPSTLAGEDEAAAEVGETEDVVQQGVEEVLHQLHKLSNDLDDL
jgi:hypothetical protein